MNFEIFIHGVPKGQKIYGLADEQIYFKTFYNSNRFSTTIEPKFLIEIRNLKGINYCYYSFLNYNNIKDYSGRAGSYFGITIRFDAFCLDPCRMAGLLYTLYQRYVIGSILSKDGKYLVPDFTAGYIIPIETTLNTLLTSSFRDEDFVPIKNIPLNQQNEYTINWCDISHTDVWQILQQGRIVFAADFPSDEGIRIIAEWEQKLENLRSMMQQELDLKNENLVNRQNQINSLSLQISQQRNQITQLENSLKGTKERNETLKKCLDDNLLREIGDSLKYIVKKQNGEKIPPRGFNDSRKDLGVNSTQIPVDGEDINENENEQGRRSYKKLKNYLWALLILLLIGGLVILYSTFVSNSKFFEKSDKKVDTNDAKIEKLEIKLESTSNKNKELQKELNFVYEQLNNFYKKKRIDIVELKDNELKLNKTYTAKIEEFPPIGKWECSGGIQEVESKESELKFTVNKEETASIKYKLGTYTIIERKIDVDD